MIPTRKPQEKRVWAIKFTPAHLMKIQSRRRQADIADVVIEMATKTADRSIDWKRNVATSRP